MARTTVTHRPPRPAPSRAQRHLWAAGQKLDRARRFYDRFPTWSNEIDLTRAEARYARAVTDARKEEAR